MNHELHQLLCGKEYYSSCRVDGAHGVGGLRFICPKGLARQHQPRLYPLIPPEIHITFTCHAKVAKFLHSSTDQYEMKF
jgi:hypothetical protein